MEQDWQMNQKLIQCNKHILENEIHCDVEFRVGGSGALIKAHKLMLANRSPVFERMFYGAIPETKFPIIISDIEGEPFRALLRYCYYESKEIERDEALPTLYAAKKYMVPDLEDTCRNILIEHLAPTNVWDVYTAGVQHTDKKLLRGCRKYFGNDVKIVQKTFLSNHFLDIPSSVLHDLLQLNDPHSPENTQKFFIVAAEIVIFKACNAWAAAECVRKEIDPSGPNKRLMLGDCLFLIRFPTILPAELVNVVFPTEILNLEEKFALLEYVHKDPASKASAKLDFISTHPMFAIQFKPNPRARPLKEYSDKISITSYSAITILPYTSLLLSEVVFDSNMQQRAIGPNRTKHAVIVVEPNTGEVHSKSVIPSLRMKLDGRPYKSVFLKDFYLKANCEYQIKIDKIGAVCFEEDNEPGPVGSILQGKVAPGVLNVEVTNSDSNDCIMYAFARLV